MCRYFAYKYQPLKYQDRMELYKIEHDFKHQIIFFLNERTLKLGCLKATMDMDKMSLKKKDCQIKIYL